MAMIIDLYHLEPRHSRFPITPDLAVLLIKPLLLDWRNAADEPYETDTVEMVRDALAGRWDVPDEILLPAIARAMQEVIVDA